MQPKIVGALCLAAGLGLGVGIAADETGAFHIERTSRVVIRVGKTGVLGFAGHAHDVVAPVTGTVTVNRADLARSRVVLEFDSGSLRVTGQGEPAADVPEVQRVMLSDRVLDVARYPRIVFESKRITRSGPQSGQPVSLLVEGDLSLHGVTRPCSVALRVTLGESSLTADGKTTLKQSDFGIQPVTAAGGTVRVRDAIEIEFTIQAARKSAAAPDPYRTLPLPGARDPASA